MPGKGNLIHANTSFHRSPNKEQRHCGQLSKKQDRRSLHGWYNLEKAFGFVKNLYKVPPLCRANQGAHEESQEGWEAQSIRARPLLVRRSIACSAKAIGGREEHLNLVLFMFFSSLKLFSWGFYRLS